MARRFVSASSQYLENSSAVVTATPFTLAAWIRLTTLPGTFNRVLTIGNTGVSDYAGIGMSNTGLVQATAQVAGAASGAVSTTGAATNVWSHVCGVFASPTSRAAYCNGSGK